MVLNQDYFSLTLIPYVMTLKQKPRSYERRNKVMRNALPQKALWEHEHKIPPVWGMSTKMNEGKMCSYPQVLYYCHNKEITSSSFYTIDKGPNAML